MGIFLKKYQVLFSANEQFCAKEISSLCNYGFSTDTKLQNQALFRLGTGAKFQKAGIKKKQCTEMLSEENKDENHTSSSLYELLMLFTKREKMD